MVFSWLPIGEFTLSWSGKKRKEEDNGQDLINQLSDDILISIIARVGTKEAVRTSILSNRWRNLYKFVPDIDLSCEHLGVHSAGCPHDDSSSFIYNKVNGFINGVDRFLRLRSGSKIRSLELYCCLTNLNADRFERFTQSIGRQGIQKLVLENSPQLVSSYLSFSCDFISHMPSLELLSLVHCSLNPMPTSLKLTQSNFSLQDVNLRYVDVHAGALESILANCPSLCSLSIFLCILPSKLFICGPNLQLKSLWIKSCGGVEEIEFRASNLATFEIYNQEVVNLTFDHAPKLQSMFVQFENKNTMYSVCSELVNSDLPHLKSLILGSLGDIYQVSSRAIGFNMFSELKKLSLSLYLTEGVNLFLLAPFLERCPLLQEFHLDTVFLKYVDGEEVTRLDVGVNHPELKKVEITGHGGTKTEIQFALYILKSAICLEQMQICRCTKWYEGRGEWMGRDKGAWNKETLEKIHGQLQGQATSKKAQLTFHHSPNYEYNLWTGPH